MPNSYLLPCIAGLLLLLFPAAGTLAQDVTLDEFSSGRHYLVAFPDTSMNAQLALYQDTRFGDRFIVQIYSSVANSFLLKSSDGKISRRYPVSAGAFVSIDLADPIFSELTPPVVSTVGAIARNTFRIDADSPVLVNCFMMTRGGSEAWSPPPVEAWGMNYFAATVPGDIVYDLSLVNNRLVKKAHPAESKILVVAAYDSTIVSLYPTGRTLPSFPTTVRLDAGQAYQFQSYVDTSITTASQQADLAGSRLIASRPIGVITGNSRAPVADELPGQLRNSYKNPFFEALTPVDQHGREFIYMPTWDARRTAAKRAAEYVRVYGTSAGTTKGSRRLTNGTTDSFTVSEGAFRQLEMDRSSPAVRIITTRPAQAMMHSSTVVQTSGVSFDSWSASMTELVPREQWSSFAPISVPIDIPGMEHFVNVVTSVTSAGSIYRENGDPFPFNQGLIAGTDLVWGTIQIPAGSAFALEGRDGARFSAISYGLSKGNETSGTINNKPYYRETIALAYSHAVAPLRRSLGAGDSLRIDSSRDCSGLRITLRNLSATPAGLRSIDLVAASNARIGSIAPGIWVNVSPVAITLSPVDPAKDATATLRIEDRTGKIWLVPFDYRAEKISLLPATGLDLGELMVGQSRRGDIMITNTTATAERIRSIALVRGDRNFTIETPPALPFALGAGASLPVTIEGKPLASPLRLSDTLRVELECTVWSIPVRMESVEPCIQVGDLRFDTVPVRQTRSLPLTICNSGKGELTFSPLSGDSIIVWSDRSFSVQMAYQNQLRSARLGPGECITIQVLFQSSQAGSFQATARIGSSAPRCTDSSSWTAVAGGTSGVREGDNEKKSMILSALGRAGEHLSIRFRHPTGERIGVELYDLRGIRRLFHDAGWTEEGDVSLSIPRGLPAGLYIVRLGGENGIITGWCPVGR